MNREIKFRYGFGLKNHYVTLDMLYEDTDAFYSRLEFRGQYTGLKDKNGKEIYEGDIIKGSYYYTGDNYFTNTINTVKFEDGCFLLINENFNSPDITDCFSLEVIGNIYENPELLTEDLNSLQQQLHEMQQLYDDEQSEE